jgi:hypothetical protein
VKFRWISLHLETCRCWSQTIFLFLWISLHLERRGRLRMRWRTWLWRTYIRSSTRRCRASLARAVATFLLEVAVFHLKARRAIELAASPRQSMASTAYGNMILSSWIASLQRRVRVRSIEPACMTRSASSAASTAPAFYNKKKRARLPSDAANFWFRAAPRSQLSCPLFCPNTCYRNVNGDAEG